MSLKGSKLTTSVLSDISDIVYDMQMGKKNAVQRLSKYVDSGLISAEKYNELLEEQNDRQLKKKTEQKRKVKDVSQRIKQTLYDVMSTITILTSGIYTLSYFISRYGKGIAVLYVLLYLWACIHIASSTKHKVENERLEKENECLKDWLKTYESLNKELKDKLEKNTNINENTEKE